MPNTQNPVIVLPGITGTSMQDEYPADVNQLWTLILNKEYERLAMHPDDSRYEAVEPALVRPGRLFGEVYGSLIGALRWDLTERSDWPTPVFPFPYDWRQDLSQTAKDLDSFLEEVIARTSLLRHYRGYSTDPKVDLVAHSMGGLVVCEYVSQFSGRRRVGKVVTLGAPYRGSIEALVKLLTGMGYLAGTPPSPREREGARSMPTIYQLLPSYPGAVVPESPGIVTDLFDLRAWQPGVFQSLAEFIRLHGIDPGNPESRARQARELLGCLLSAARSHRTLVEQLDLEASGLSRKSWLAIVGIGARTRIRVSVALQNAQPRYSIRESDFVDQWKEDHQSRETGDNTVPLEAAIPPFLDSKEVVAVTPDDYGFWEWKDRTLGWVAGFHVALPNLNLVQRLTLRHLRPRYRGEVWGHPAPGVPLNNWDPPIPELRPADEHA